MSHQWILTPIIIPEVKAVMFRPGASLNMFNDRMLISTLPDELKHQPSGLISLADQYLSDDVGDERASKPVLNLTIDPEPPASLMLKPKLQRWINDSYLQWVKSQPCCVCNSIAHEAHHLIGHGQGGMGTKAHDLFTIPLCRIHHSELHKDPNGWERGHGSQLIFLIRFLDRSAALGVFG